MAQLLGLALACDQTRVFNMVFSNSSSSLHNPGGSSSHHLYTHEEAVDPELGYQAMAAAFVEENMRAFAEFVQILDGIDDGDGTLLDHTVVLALGHVVRQDPFRPGHPHDDRGQRRRTAAHRPAREQQRRPGDSRRTHHAAGHGHGGRVLGAPAPCRPRSR
jgi:hypothetical protein